MSGPFLPVQLCDRGHHLPHSGDGWTFEQKFDGYRTQLIAGEAGIRIFSRNGQDWTDRLRDWLQPLHPVMEPGTVLDGELCVRRSDGRSSFSELARAMRSDGPLRFHAFDILSIGSTVTTNLPLTDRRRLLERVISDAGRERLQPVRQHSDGHALLDAMRVAGHEGVVAKRLDAPYRAGRTHEWLKFKCTHTEEFLAVGCHLLEAGTGVASLVLASAGTGRLIYRGRVGTGFTLGDRRELARRLTADQSAPPTLQDGVRLRGAIWCRDPLVVQVGFAGFSASGSVLHPVFQGVREDITLAEFYCAA